MCCNGKACRCYNRGVFGCSVYLVLAQPEAGLHQQLVSIQVGAVHPLLFRLPVMHFATALGRMMLPCCPTFYAEYAAPVVHGQSQRMQEQVVV